jgi:hypothetical protein
MNALLEGPAVLLMLYLLLPSVRPDFIRFARSTLAEQLQKQFQVHKRILNLKVLLIQPFVFGPLTNIKLIYKLSSISALHGDR